MIRRITPPPLKNLYFCLQVRDIIVDVEKALISAGEALKNLLLSKNYATHHLSNFVLSFASYTVYDGKGSGNIYILT